MPELNVKAGTFIQATGPNARDCGRWHHVGTIVTVVCTTKGEEKQYGYTQFTAKKVIDSEGKHETSSFLCAQEAV